MQVKILELEIDNIRGIRHLELSPKGRNFLISGPNGSGKSAIVDSIDFLLTGDISRMEGKGTKGITLKKHGIHVDAKPEDSWVRAVVKLHGIEEPVEIKRNFKDKKLIIDSEYLDNFKPILELASRGQHVLTRREILNFVTAEASTRAGQVQKLLKLDDIEEHRKKLGNVRNSLKNEFQNSEANLNQAKADICVTIGEEEYNPSKLLKFINQQRQILDGEDIAAADYKNLKERINPPASRPDSKLNPGLIKKDVENIWKITHNENIAFYDERLRELSTKFRESPFLDGAAKRLRLTRLGIELIGGDGNCPLCDKSWEPSELKEHLEAQLKLYQEAKDDLEEMDQVSNKLSGCINRLQASIQELYKVLEEWNFEDEKLIFNQWLKDLPDLTDSLKELENYPPPKFKPDKIVDLLAPLDLTSVLEKVEEKITDINPEITPEQLAWDYLTRLEENLKLYEKNLEEYQHSAYSYKQGVLLFDAFTTAREKILNQLYTEIKDRFVELYRELHGIDESEFEATLISSGAGIDFQVDFHGRGENPPHALHSEGHQDSMGICLYLALAERLTQGYIDLIVLDDVMMSVDAPHRRKICHLLADFFKGKQFFITTHDETWARQLRSEGVVSARGIVQLYNWTIDSGPLVNSQIDMWEAIEKSLNNHDVPAAAHRLRRGSEEYFRAVCNALGVKVTFRDGNQYTLGDFLPEAISRYKYLLNEAKDSANSWNKKVELERLSILAKSSRKIFDKSQAENWAVNANVHYNKWTDFTLEDFKPVVDAYQDLFSLFKCDICDGLLHLTMNGPLPEVVKCKCGDVVWNLEKKK